MFLGGILWIMTDKVSFFERLGCIPRDGKLRKEVVGACLVQK